MILYGMTLIFPILAFVVGMLNEKIEYHCLLVVCIRLWYFDIKSMIDLIVFIGIMFR